MTVTSGDIHLRRYKYQGNSNNDLFARKLSSRIDLDLFCIEILSKFFAFSLANASKAVKQTVRHKVGRY